LAHWSLCAASRQIACNQGMVIPTAAPKAVGALAGAPKRLALLAANPLVDRGVPPPPKNELEDEAAKVNDALLGFAAAPNALALPAPNRDAPLLAAAENPNAG
jgi:hypothetical protein